MNEADASPGTAQEAPAKRKRFNPNPIIVKVAFVAIVFGLLQIPLTMILETIQERENFNVSYPQNYKGAGAGQQTIVGPVLTIPYRYQVTEEKQIASDDSVSAPTVKTTKTETSFLHLFPDDLKISGTLVPELRDGGKFKNIIYTAALNFSGKFDTSEVERKRLKGNAELLWKEAFLTLGISDLRGIRKQSLLTWDKKEHEFIPGTNGLILVDSGQYTLLDGLKKNSTYPFSLALQLNGSHQLDIFPAGKESKIELSSSWKDPTFPGGFLPSKYLHNEKSGFNAEWNVSYFNRNTPQVWTDQDPDLKNSLAQYMLGVTLATPIEFYRTAVRAVKYGCLFIIMPFLTFFIFEMVMKVKIHEMQYLLVGLALSLFFLMLIAISEYIPFVWAYIIASAATNAQISWYTSAFSKASSPHLWKIIAATLAMLYSYLYMLLQLEDMSLLVGAIGLFVALSFVLYTTRHINWHTQSTEPNLPKATAV